MGGVEVEGAVRYVSPVTARLFSKEGSAALGLTGEVLVPLEEASPVWGRHRTTSQQIPQQEQQQRQQQQGMMIASSKRGVDGAGQRHSDFVISPTTCPSSPPTDDENVTSPQACFEAILTERRYDCTTRTSASEGCRCAPTQKQIDDYQIPLIEAVRRGDLQTLETLAASGVDMGASNRFGESIVHLATRRGSAPVLEFLLNHSASVRICDDYGKTPMHDAFWTAEPRFDLVAMMLDVDWRLLRAADVRGATPLRYAKKRHWRMWCAFLNQVKDRHWPPLPTGEREIGAEVAGASI